QGCVSTRSFPPAARMFGAVGSTASAGSFWPFRAATFGGLPTLTRAPVPPGAAGPAAWAAGNAVDSAQTRLPAAASTRNRRFLRPSIEPPAKVCRSFTAAVIGGKQNEKRQPTTEAGEAPRNRDIGSASPEDPLVQAIKESLNGQPDAQGSGEIAPSARRIHN